MLSSTLAHALPQPQPVIVRTETVRRGEVRDAEARVRWLKRPEARPQGWHSATLEINGTSYAAEAFFTADDAGRHWLIVDLFKPDGKHVRVCLGQGQEECDCEHYTYRHVTCKHLAGIHEALDQLDALERAEFELKAAGAALDAALAEVPF